MNYTARKDNVVFIDPRITNTDNNPQPVTDSAPFSKSVPAVPVDTCGFTKHSISKYQQMMADLSELDAGRLTMSALKSRWWKEFNSFSAMRYQRTCLKGGCTRHPAFDTFPAFLFHVGPKNHPDDTLDKIDPTNREYGPDLCRWASKRTQSHNRGSTKLLTDSQGNSHSIAEWSRKIGISESTIRGRLAAGKSDDEALYTPVGGFEKSAPAKDNTAVTGGLVELWRRVLKDKHDQGFYSPDGKEIGQLGQIADRLAKGKVWPDQCVEYVLKNWQYFTDYAEREYAVWQKRPRVPTVAFLHAGVNAAGNFYLDSKKPRPVHKDQPLFKPLKVAPKPVVELEPEHDDSGELHAYLVSLDV